MLRDFRQLLDLYSVERIRAVATTAVREASNADTFLDRVFMATRLNIEVIDTSEESRLTVSAVRQAISDLLGINHRTTLIADVGGGSTLLTLLQDGEIATSQSLRLGSIRLQEVFSTSEETPQRSAEMLRHHISNVISTFQNSMPLQGIESFVAVGGDARFAAREVGVPTESADLVLIDRKAFDELVDRCERHTAEELSKRYGLPFDEAETLNPALLVYQVLLQKTQIRQMIVSHVSMRDGLLLELAREVTGQEDTALLTGIIHSATALAEKYHVDLDHARNVADVAVRLFDYLQAEHGLAAAASSCCSAWPGSARNRRIREQPGAPQAQRVFDRQFGDLRPEPPGDHLRVADRPLPSPQRPAAVAPGLHGVAAGIAGGGQQAGGAAARGRRPGPRPCRGSRPTSASSRQGDELIVFPGGAADVLLEQRAMESKGDMFEDIYGMKIRLEPAVSMAQESTPVAASVHQPRAELAGVQPPRAAGRALRGLAAAGAAEVPGHRQLEPRRVLPGPRGRADAPPGGQGPPPRSRPA